MPKIKKEIQHFLNLYNNKRYKDIIQDSQQYVADQKHDATLLKIIGASHLHLGQNSEAVSILSEKLDKFKTDPEVLNSLGVAYRRLGDLDKALLYLKSAVNIDPLYVEALNNRGAVLWDAGQLDSALEHFDAALRLNPRYLDAAFNKAKILVLIGNFSEAEQMMRYGLQLDDTSERFLEALGGLLLEQGSIEESVHYLRRTLSLYPKNINALNNIGNAFLKLGNISDAIECFDQILLIDEKSALAYYNRGIAQRAMKLLDSAIESFKSAAKIKSNSLQILTELANTLRDDGRFVEAENLYIKLISLNEKSVYLRLNYGVLLSRRELLDAAVEQYRIGLNLDPDDHKINNNLGNILRIKGQPNEAIGHYKRSLKSKPGDADVHYNLGIALQDIKSYQEAEDEYLAAINLVPEHSLAYLNLGGLLKAMGRPFEAIECYRASYAGDRNNPDSQYNLGVVLMELGEFDGAIKAFEAALEVDRYHVGSLRNLTGIKAFNGGELFTQRLFELWHQGGLPARLRAEIGFAIYNQLSKRGEYEQAFRFLTEANASRRLDGDFTLEGELKAVQKIKEYAKSVHAIQSFDGLALEATPIFIVGMPRSGTTLVEQIISSHSAVFGAGEMPFLKEVVLKLIESQRGLQEVAPLIAEQYYESVSSNAKEREYFTDKMPQNFLFLPLMIASFPKSKVIHVFRDARATIWSNFERYFPEGLDYSYSLKDLVGYYNMYSGLMREYSDLLGDRIYHLSYERLTENQHSETLSLFDYLGLIPEPVVFRPHENNRIVATASNEQVRTPVYKGSSQKWRKYASYIANDLDAVSQFKI